MSAKPAMLNVTETETGLVFPVAFTFEQWAEVFEGIQRDHKSAMWRLGDAAIIGEMRFGELYAQAVTNYSAETIETAMRVCRAIPAPRRRPCGFYWHQVIYALPVEWQDELLDLVAEDPEKWTREAFRQVVRDYKAQKKAENEPQLPVEPAESAEAPEPAPRPFGDGAAAGPGSDAPPAPGAPPDDGEASNFEHHAVQAHRPSYVIQDAAVIPPAGPEPMPAEDGAQMLRHLGGAALPTGIAAAIAGVLVEREKLLTLRAVASRAVKAGYITPELRVAVEAVMPESDASEPSRFCRLPKGCRYAGCADAGRCLSGR